MDWHGIVSNFGGAVDRQFPVPEPAGRLPGDLGRADRRGRRDVVETGPSV